MSLNLGEIEQKNRKKQGENYKNVGGLKLKISEPNNTPSTNKKEQSSSQKRNWLQSGAFSDGYQVGDVTKTALSTIGDIGTNLFKGVLRAGESLGDLAAYGGAQIVDKVGNKKYADEVRKAAAEDLTGKIFKKVDEKIDKNSILGEKMDDVVSSIGNMYAQGVTSTKLLGNKGNIPLSIGGKKFNLPVTSLISGASSGMAEAVNKNAEDWQIWANGITGGLSEGISESLFGTFGIGGSDLDDAIVSGITKNMTDGLVKSLTKAGIKAAGEGVEEVASYLLNYGSQHLMDYAKNKTGIKGVDLGEKFNKEEVWENFFSGALAAGIGGIPSTINSIKGKQNKGININEGINQFNINNDINQNETVHQDNELLSNKKYSQNTNQNVYQFEKDNNVKINNLKKSATKYFNNSEQTHNFIDNISKIISDKNYDVIFDDKIVNQKGLPVNAQIKQLSNGEVEIRINPNSPKAGEFLIVHEVTHAIETQEMKDLVLDYASRHDDFKQALNDLKTTYGTDDVTSEVLADISGQLFGNQEFINNLSLEKPSVFKRIYNSIISLANKITGNSHEALFIRDLKNKWETAYRNTTQEQAINNVRTTKNNFTKISDFDLSEYKKSRNIILNKNEFAKLANLVESSDVRRGVNKIENIYDETTNSYKDYTIYKKEKGIFKVIDSNLSEEYNISRDDLNEFDGKSKNVSKRIEESGRRGRLDSLHNETIENAETTTSDDGLSQDNKKQIREIEQTNSENDRNKEYSKELDNNSSLKENAKLPTKYSMQNSQDNTHDNQGRKLSQQQQDFFKNSTVRDKNGNLLTLFHGTKNDFTVFDINKSGQSNSVEATAGFWFTENKKGAEQFSNEVWYGDNDTAKSMEVYLNLENPKIYENVDNSKKIQTIEKEQKEIYSQLRHYNDKYNVTFDIITNQPEQNVFYDISRYSYLSDSELKETIKQWAKPDDVNEYFNDIKKYNELNERKRILERQRENLRYTDSYEQFRNDIYEIAGMDATDANMGGTGMVINNSEQVMKQYIDGLKNKGYDGIIIKGTNYDSNRFGNQNNQYVAFYSNQIKNVDNINPTINEDIRYSQNSSKWQEYLDKHYTPSGTRTNMNDIKIPTSKDINKINMPPVETKEAKNKVLNPNEISQLTLEDANTTPKIPKIDRNNLNDGKSKFAKNIQNKVNMLNEEQKTKILSDEEVRFYDKVTNKESLDKAFDKLNNGGKSESLRWFNKDSKNADATDVAEGWILMKQYADSSNYDGMVEIAKKLRDIGTKAGQTVQAFNIMERMTPEGMVKYAQSELQEAWEKMRVNKTKEWIDKHRGDFDLTSDEVQFIMDNMKEVSTMEDGYDKRVKLAEIQKIMTDKLPPIKGSGIKSWMRISMLFNPKTQVRNVVGNAIIMPVNSFGDLFASYADKIIAKKTGVRTTGRTNIKAMLKGMKEGAFQATNDYKKGINTKDMDGNRFEITDGKTFNDKTLIGKSLNRVDGLLNYVMDVGDRVFSQAAFENSLQNQLILNNTTEITKEMIDIARAESLQRTWNDNNNYTKFVLNARRGLNQIHLPGVESYGLGDVLIPFAKTPANLTKAIVDYSPVGLLNTLVEGNNLRKSITNGQFTAQMQHKFVQDLGRATAGTMLYVLGAALAMAKITSGKSDDDKDVSNFLKNTLGVSSYSIKIGNKSFTYDWAQPIAAPLSIMANVVSSKSNKGQALTEAIVSSLDTAGGILLEQSFLQSLNDVLNSNDGVVSGLINEMLELPARAIPTFSKQIADMVDGTQRQTFEYDKPLKSALNSIKAKIPYVSKNLAPTVDTMGREVKKYGDKNNIFNVFLNPANVNTENISESAKEIYRLYKITGNTNLMPRVAPYYINNDNEKIILNSEQRAKYQKDSGKIIESEIQKLLNSENYKKLDDNQKSDVINDIVNYSYNIAQKNLLNKELSNTYKKAYEYSKIGDVSDYYTLKNSIDNTNSNNKKESIKNYLVNSKLDDKQIAKLYSYYYSSENKLNSLLEMNIPIKEFIKFDTSNIEGEYDASTGKTISGSKKTATIKYINSLNLSIPQKAILIKMNYHTYDDYNNQIINYINQLNQTANEKKVLLKRIGFDDYDSEVIKYIMSKYSSQEEQETVLKDLGFTIRNGRVYW